MSRCTLGQGIFPWMHYPSWSSMYQLHELVIPRWAYLQLAESTDPHSRALAKAAKRLPEWMGE